VSDDLRLYGGFQPGVSRDMEIERIDMDEAAEIGRIADALMAYGFYTERGYSPTMSADRLPGVLYDAGLRSQPASEPSLDVAWTPEYSRGYSDGYNDGLKHPTGVDEERLTEAMTVVGWHPDVAANVAAKVAPEYLRLTQPADNEAAE
jgi:hypothetical protein